MLEVRLEGLSRSFAERQVIRDLTATIPSGERCVVRGPNGSGKTTLLKIVAGVLHPSGGRVRVICDGEERDAAWIRRWTGFMGPDLFLYDELSAEENLDFFARVRGLPRDPGRERRLLERVRLDHRRDDPIRTLSTGLRQRAKLAFAIQAEPRILLLDEPSSNLDPEGRQLVKDVVDAVAGRDQVVLLATNDPEEREWGTTNLDLV